MTTSAHRRKVLITALGAGLLVVFLILASLNAWDVKFLNPATTAQIVIYTALSAVAFLVFIGVMLTLVRNVLKLYADQKSRVMGSRLRTRMLIGAVLVSLIPIVFMFVFSYGLMNRAVDRWFSQPVTQMRDNSSRMAHGLSQYANANARVEAEAIAAALPAQPGQPQSAAPLQHLMSQHEITLQGGFIVIYRDGRAVAAYHLPRNGGQPAALKHDPADVPSTTAEEDSDQPVQHTAQEAVEPIDPNDTQEASLLAAAQRADDPMFAFAGKDYALGTAPVLRRERRRHRGSCGPAAAG